MSKDEQDDPLARLHYAESEAFEIDSEERANWLLRKLHAIDCEVALVHAQAEAILTRLRSQREQTWNRYGAQLEHWAKSQLAGGKKSVILLYGTCAFRTVPTSIRVADEKAALDWCAEHPDRHALVQHRATLDKRAYTALVKETGEALPGIEISPERVSFTLKFEENEDV